MLIEKAKDYFLGKIKIGDKKFNCCQSIIITFKDKFNLNYDIKQFESYGGGKAPDGVCGSLYAAKLILEKTNLEKYKECENFFLTNAGSLKCKEIRALKKLSCVGCVEKIAEFLDNLS